MRELYIGSALSTVSKRGEISLPPTFRRTARRRGSSITPLLLIDQHPAAACLTVYDRLFVERAVEDAWRTILCDDTRADPAIDVALRRRFGFAVEVGVQANGRFVLPTLPRVLAGIGDSVLLVATGEQFQIWDVAFILESGPPDLVALVNLHRPWPAFGGEDHARALLPVRSPRPDPLPGKPGLPLQSLRAMSSRPDAFGTGRRR